MQVKEATPATDLEALKLRQQKTWESGDFAVVGVTLQIVGERLAESVNVLAGEKVLDVAAGNGNATLAAARRFADVTSTDYVGHLLDKGRARAEAEGMNVTFQQADAENLPFADQSFDVVLSTFGSMFAPNHARTASEMRRVCRTGGRIGLVSWTPDGFLGDLFRTVARHVPPPSDIDSPMLWGTPHHLAKIFNVRLGDMQNRRRHFNFRYRSVAHFIEIFREYYGPTHKAFAALDEAGRGRLHEDLVRLLMSWNSHRGIELVIPASYLETVIHVD